MTADDFQPLDDAPTGDWARLLASMFFALIGFLCLAVWCWLVALFAGAF